MWRYDQEKGNLVSVAACSSFLHLEIHECNEDDHTCQHICNNTHGSFVCSCFDGYNLASNGFSCNGISILAYFRIYELYINQFNLTDIDECTVNTHACDHICHNTPGSYSCSCRPGYTLDQGDRRTCTGNVYSQYRGVISLCAPIVPVNKGWD